MATSLLDQLDETFKALATRPCPPAIDGKTVHPDLPQRQINVVELRSILLHPSTSYDARDAALGEVVRRAQSRDSDWSTAAVGMLLHGLRRTAGRLARGHAGDTDDLDAEIVAGLLDAIHSCDASSERVASRLLWAAYRHGLRFRVGESEAPSPAIEVDLDLAPEGHPDLILTDAVADGVITPEEAALIASTRLGEVALPDLAEKQQVTQDTLRHRRRRAELRLAAWITGGAR